MRAEGKPVVVVDAGDLVGNPIWQSRLKAETAITAMNWMGYDAWGLGESDFGFGPDGVTQLADQADFPVLALNVIETAAATPFTLTRHTVEASGIDVSIVSVLDPSLMTQPMTDSYGNSWVASDATNLLATELQAARADANVVVLIAHSGLPRAWELATAFPDVDIIVAAHGSPYLNPGYYYGEPYVVASGPQGKYIGRVDITLDAYGTVRSAYGAPVMLGPGIPDASDVAQLYQDYLASLPTYVNDILAAIPQDPPPTGSAYVGSAACQGCHATETAQWLTTPHATAFQVIRDQNHEYDLDCLPCHSTGFGFQGGFRLETVTPTMVNVQCESCHGAGADHAAAPAAGYGPVSEPICRNCHEASRFPNWSYPAAYPAVVHP